MTNGADPLFQALQQTVCLIDTSLVIKLIGLQPSAPQVVYFKPDIQFLLSLQQKLTVINL